MPAHVLPPVHPPTAVVTIHDLGYLHYPTAHPPVQRLYLHWSTLWNVRTARVILADSQATIYDLSRYLRVPAARTVLAYPGVNEAFYPQPDSRVDEVRRHYRLPSSYLLYVGTIQPRKNVSRLLAAHALVSEAPPLVLVGAPGWLSKGILREIEATGERVRMLGYVPDDDLPALLTGAQALALPSLYEGFGIPALEAMACGTPVVASRTSSLPEVVGDCGILVDPLSIDDIARGLELVCHNREFARHLGDCGRIRARQFTWAACAQAALTAIEKAYANATI
ncbi:MAG: glycosyltransferase family 4 protein [Anaerolineae bacterium]